MTKNMNMKILSTKNTRVSKPMFVHYMFSSKHRMLLSDLNGKYSVDNPGVL